MFWRLAYSFDKYFCTAFLNRGRSWILNLQTAMEEDIFHLTDKEIEEMISELEHTYAEFLQGDAHVRDLHKIRKRILELQQEIISRRTN